MMQIRIVYKPSIFNKIELISDLIEHTEIETIELISNCIGENKVLAISINGIKTLISSEILKKSIIQIIEQ